MDQLHLFSAILQRGRPQPLVVWMHEEERTFLLPGDTAGNLEVTTDAALLVTSPKVQEEILFFRTHKRARFPTYEYNDLFIKSEKCYLCCLSRLHTP